MKVSPLKNPFYALHFPDVLRDIDDLRKNRKVMTKFYPTSVNPNDNLAVQKYHQEALTHWYDEDDTYITNNFDEDEIHDIVQGICWHGDILIFFDEDPLVDFNDVYRCCKKELIGIDWFFKWMIEKSKEKTWVDSPSIGISLRNLFSKKYAEKLHQRFFVNWD